MIKTDKSLTEVKELFRQGKLKGYGVSPINGIVSYELKKTPAPKNKENTQKKYGSKK